MCICVYKFVSLYQYPWQNWGAFRHLQKKKWPHSAVHFYAQFSFSRYRNSCIYPTYHLYQTAAYRILNQHVHKNRYVSFFLSLLHVWNVHGNIIFDSLNMMLSSKLCTKSRSTKPTQRTESKYTTCTEWNNQVLNRRFSEIHSNSAQATGKLCTKYFSFEHFFHFHKHI